MKAMLFPTCGNFTFQTRGYSDYYVLESGGGLRYQCTTCLQSYRQLRHLRRHQTHKHGRMKTVRHGAAVRRAVVQPVSMVPNTGTKRGRGRPRKIRPGQVGGAEVQRSREIRPGPIGQVQIVVTGPQGSREIQPAPVGGAEILVTGPHDLEQQREINLSGFDLTCDDVADNESTDVEFDPGPFVQLDDTN